MKNLTYYVTSDIHSDKEITAFLTHSAIKENAKLFIIAGDLCPKDLDMALILKNAPFETLLIKGNCDSVWDFKDLSLLIPQISDEYKMEDGRSIYITHGHIFETVESLLFQMNKGDIIITGHTHVPHLYIDENGIIHLNPGSPSRPRGFEGATYAVINENEITIRRVKDGKTIKSLKLKD